MRLDHSEYREVQSLYNRVHKNTQFLDGTVLHYTDGTSAKSSSSTRNKFISSILFIRTSTHMHTHISHLGVPREEQVESRSASLPNTRDRQVGISSKSTAWYTNNHQQVPSHSDHRQDSNAKKYWKSREIIKTSNGN